MWQALSDADLTVVAPWAFVYPVRLYRAKPSDVEQLDWGSSEASAGRAKERGLNAQDFPFIFAIANVNPLHKIEIAIAVVGVLINFMFPFSK